MSSNSKNLFESMTRRRVSCPLITQQLWDAIKMIRLRHVPTAERIQKVMQKEFGVGAEEVTRQLNHCVRDGLLEVTKRTVNKGSFAGSEQEGYNLPLLKMKPDDYDWYCFDCHRAGDVICCSKPSCLRVYHLACISATELPQPKFRCHVCRMCDNTTGDKFTMKRSRMNKLLALVLQKLKSKYPLLLKDQRLPRPSKTALVSDRTAQALAPAAACATAAATDAEADADATWRRHLLIARDMNLWIMEEKIDLHRYRLLEQFQADALTIVHNMVIYNGVDSAVADLARQMLRDCVVDLREIRQCVDCYKAEHDRKKMWFCKPCRTPHELVYAKLPGQPYSPAKVLKIDGDQYEVRLFGAPYIRATVPKAHIRPISVNIHTLQVKRSSGWNRACDELKRHQELLEKQRAIGNLGPESSSGSERESIDSETERLIEKNARMAKVKQLMDKQRRSLGGTQMATGSGSGAISGGGKRRSSAGEKRGRGRPKLSDSLTDGKGGRRDASWQLLLRGKTKGKSNKGRVLDLYDSSDSLDSLQMGKPAQKKNTDEMFDELLKSDPIVHVNTLLSSRNEKLRKSSTTSSEITTTTIKRTPRRLRTASVIDIPPPSEDSRLSRQTLDSSTISSDSNTTQRRRRKHASNNSLVHSSSESDNDDDSSMSTKRIKSTEKLPKQASTSGSSSSTSSSSDSELKMDKVATQTKRRTVPARSARAVRRKSTSSSSSTDSTSSSDNEERKKDKKRKKKKPVVKVETRLKKALAKQQQNKIEELLPNKDMTERDDKSDSSSDSETPLSRKRVMRKPTVAVKRFNDEEENEDEEDDEKRSSLLESDGRSREMDEDDEDDQQVKKDDEQSQAKTKLRAFSKLELKEKEEIVVSSSSQEPVTRSASVQTLLSGESGTTVEVAVSTPSAAAMAEMESRCVELEEELQLSKQSVKMLELELNKSKVLLDRLRAVHDDELAEITSRHARLISDIKKKQWCYNCETEAIYHCCWNTAYCSVECQQAHWQSEHKRVCRRKR